MIEYNSIRGHIVSEIRKEIEPTTAQKLKPLLGNSESLIKSAKETYAHQLKVLKEELHCKNKIINTLLGIIEKIGNDKRDTQPVSLINFEKDLTSPNKIDSETNPKSDEQQQSHDNKQQIFSKELSENSKEKNGTNSVLVTDSELYLIKIINNKTMMISKKVTQQKLCQYRKAESSNSTTNGSIDEQLDVFKRKKKEEYYKYKQSVCSDAGEKDKSVKNDQWPIGTTVIVGDSILNGRVEEKLCGQGRLVKVKRFPGSTVDDLNPHIIPTLRKKPTNMIIHTGTNYSPSSTSREIQDNLSKLKPLDSEKLPQCKVWLSTPTLRTDNGKGTLTVSQLVNHLLNLNIDVIDNRNIKSRHLSRKDPHLSDSGSKLLARNFLEKIKLF